MQQQLKIKDMVYYARIFPTLGIYDVCDITIRRVEDTWFVGIDKHDKHAYLFNNSDINDIVFIDRMQALNKVLEAELKAPQIKVD